MTEILEEEDLFFEHTEVKEDSHLYVNFNLGQEWYGIEIGKAKEVVKVPSITNLPGAPFYIIGVINLRGSILTVIDLKRIFGFAKEMPKIENRIVVLEHEEMELGFLVDKVSELIDLPVSKIDPPIQTLEGYAAEFIEGECKINNRLLNILNVDKVFQMNPAKPASGG